MTIILDIAPDLQAELSRRAAVEGTSAEAYAASLLAEALHRQGTVRSATPRTPEEIRAWLDELAAFSDEIPPQPGQTFSREMIYQDHD